MAHRKRRCLNCKSYYPVDGGIVCNLGFFHNNDCRIDYGVKNSKKIVEKVREDKAKKHRKELREFRGNDKTKRAKAAQAAFNAFVRKRDEKDPCISCGRFHKGQIHAGHYKTTKARPDLRFNEDNCHAQCAPCNNHLSGNIENYRPNLIKKIGRKRFDALELEVSVKRSIDELREIERFYKIKLKQIL